MRKKKEVRKFISKTLFKERETTRKEKTEGEDQSPKKLKFITQNPKTYSDDLSPYQIEEKIF